MKRPYFNIIFFLVIAGTMISLAIAQESGQKNENEAEISGILFPVKELGGCVDKKACKAFCDNPENMDACISFAEKNGLMDKKEAEESRRFAGAIKKDGGPGGCSSPAECELYCSVIDHIDECVSFAKKNNFKHEKLDEAEKISKYLKSGKKLPGGCTSKESCEAFCSDFANVKECMRFAKDAKISVKKGSDEITPENMEKFAELAEKGETPGGCKSESECRDYCEDATHFDECITFAEKAGLMPKDKVEKIKKLGGRGPGGCSSSKTCEAYCSDEAHRGECFNFAREHGLLEEGEIKEAEEGMIKMREGLSHLPDDLKVCIRSSVGQNIIEDIQSGELTPGQEIGERMRGCFERFDEEGDGREPFSDAPAEVISCLKEKLGSDFDEVRLNKKRPTPQMADTFRMCFEKNEILNGGQEGVEGSDIGKLRTRRMEFLRSAPPEMEKCLREKLGDDFVVLGSGEKTEEMEQKMRACFESFKPEVEIKMELRQSGAPQSEEKIRKEEFFEKRMENASGQRNAFPPEVISCLKEGVPEEKLRLLLRGDEPDSEISEKIKACFGSRGEQNGGQEFNQEEMRMRQEIEMRQRGEIEMRARIEMMPEGDMGEFKQFNDQAPQMPPSENAGTSPILFRLGSPFAAIIAPFVNFFK